ncbi:apolipoprotein L3-like [Acipenser oxyrinchus oxyrinchus]|uniref:Apolipoprotein L3-like n=1 Tax=Acipenser oxyrinchus oxyrinchus TaxID=40147 RepID=A0AAD8CE20_ACIOX|nr:apolipoprotein L3-like [Acipenser oxyrinchus oxyrinchus]
MYQRPQTRGNLWEYDPSVMTEEVVVFGEHSTEQRIEEFARLFRAKKPIIKRHLKELGEIADGLDEANMNAALAKTIRSFVGAAGGIMTLAGLFLDPKSQAASSLQDIREKGVALGEFAKTTTDLAQAISDRSHNQRADELLGKVEAEMLELSESVNNAFKSLTELNKSRHEGKSSLLLQLSNSLAPIIARYVKTTFICNSGHSSPGLTLQDDRLARVVGVGIWVAKDVYEMTSYYEDMQQGCKSERAEEIRKVVESVAADLHKLKQVYSYMLE